MASKMKPLARPHATPRLVLALAVGLACGMLGHFAWQGLGLYRLHLTEAADKSPSTPTSVNVAPKVELSASLLQLFGAKQRNLEQAESNAVVPESTLNLQVSAIFLVAPIEQSSVIIEDGDQTKILRRGEQVRPGILVERIQSDRVTLKRNGKLEQISLRGFAEGSSAPPREMVQQAPPPEPMPMDTPTAAPAGLATPYQQFIQRKLAQSQ
ncbi:MAG TPA: type II secretion system protein N [Pseudomonas sp.]|nr:type II secretion system protein N [Pseudomonas sp.]